MPTDDRAFQAVFVRLATQDADRAHFARDPRAYAHHHLSGRAALALAAVAPAALDRFARSLTSKRWAALARVVPGTARVVPDLGARYRRWLGAHPSPGDRPELSPGESEALRALPHLRRELSSDDGEAPWAADLLAFEALRACSRRDGRVRSLRSSWPLAEVASVLQAGEIPLDPEPGDFSWRFTRPPSAPASGAPCPSPRTGFLGAGIGLRGPHHAALLRGEARPAVLEVMPDHFFARPDALAPLAALCPLVFHDVGLSLGTVGFEDADRLARIRALVEIGRPVLLSDHLCLSRGPVVDGFSADLGHLAPLWYTKGLLAAVRERIQRLQDFFGLPIAVENITAPFAFDFADFSEPEFFHALVDATGCGVLLDLTNLWINGHNLGFDPATRLAEYPLEAVVQVHLAGGQTAGDWWVDSHAAPVEEPCFDLLARLRGRAPLRCIIVERDAHLPPLADLLAEAARAEAVWMAKGG